MQNNNNNFNLIFSDIRSFSFNSIPVTNIPIFNQNLLTNSVEKILIPLRAYSYGIQKNIVSSHMGFRLFDTELKKPTYHGSKFINSMNEIKEQCINFIKKNDELKIDDNYINNHIRYERDYTVALDKSSKEFAIKNAVLNLSDQDQNQNQNNIAFSKTFFIDSNTGIEIDRNSLVNRGFYAQIVVQVDSISITNNRHCTLKLKLVECEVLDLSPIVSYKNYLSFAPILQTDEGQFQIISISPYLNIREDDDSFIKNHTEAYQFLCDEFGSMISEFPWNVAPTVIAGGSALYTIDFNCETFGDIDFFVYNINNNNQLIRWLIASFKHFEKFGYVTSFDHENSPFITSNAVTLKHPSKPTIQLIYRMRNYSSVEELFTSFDISCARVGICDKNLYFGYDAKKSISHHRIIFDSSFIDSSYNGIMTGMKRLQKYINRGYSLWVPTNFASKVSYLYCANIIRMISESNDFIVDKYNLEKRELPHTLQDNYDLMLIRSKQVDDTITISPKYIFDILQQLNHDTVISKQQNSFIYDTLVSVKKMVIG